MGFWWKFTSRIIARRRETRNLRIEIVTSPNCPEPLRILLPTRLAREAVGWHLGIKSLYDTLSSSGIPIDIKVFHINGVSRLDTVADIVLFSFSSTSAMLPAYPRGPRTEAIATLFSLAAV
jgi:hypothetical protein